MDMIITFDICSIFILGFLLLSLFLRKMTKGFSNMLFIILILDVLSSAVVDILCVVSEIYLKPSTISLIISYILNYCYYFFHNSLTPLYLLFVFSICGMWHDFLRKPLIKILWAIPVSIDLISFALNPFIKNLFYITDDLQYHRGYAIVVLYFVAAYCILFSIISIIRKRNLVSISKFWVMISLFPLNIFGIIVQFIFPNVLLETLTTAISLLLIYIVVQRPEEGINLETESLNFYAFHDEIKKNFLLKRQMHVIFIELVNYDAMQKQIRSVNLQMYITDLIKNLTQICSIGETEVYYLSSGMFAIISLKNDESKILTLAERVNIFFHQKARIGIMDFTINTRICLAKCPQNLPDLNAVLTFCKNFSDVIYEMNKVVYLDVESKTSDFQIRNQINEILSKAIKNHNFEIYFQPIYEVKSKQFVSAEALVRLNDEHFGFISPNLFIIASEKSGAIHQIGDFIFEDVFDFASKTDFESLNLQAIEINLSLAQCIERNLFDKIKHYLDTYKISPERVNFEITESEVEFTREVSDKNIKMLHDYGIKFSLDDYGTGYSNIKRLTSLPFDIIKLDKTFADDFENPQMKIIINNTVSMLKQLNKKILVEGVSDQKTLDYFTELGCDYIQGFYFSKPLPKDDFINFMKERNTQVV
ncbi:MAG: EAL domain-containing protein [Treponema sp.]|nr:EAL domain-containing protein [Treponema sp.]